MAGLQSRAQGAREHSPRLLWLLAARPPGLAGGRVAPVTRLLVASPLCVCVSCCFAQGHSSSGFGTKQIIQGDSLSSSTRSPLQRPFLQIRSCLQVLGVRTWACLLGGSPAPHCSWARARTDAQISCIADRARIHQDWSGPGKRVSGQMLAFACRPPSSLASAGVQGGRTSLAAGGIRSWGRPGASCGKLDARRPAGALSQIWPTARF